MLSTITRSTWYQTWLWLAVCAAMAVTLTVAIAVAGETRSWVDPAPHTHSIQTTSAVG